MVWKERFWLIFNGEIYNYREIREELSAAGAEFKTGTDSEVLLASFEKWGRACVQKFNGMWAFAIWDSSNQSLFLSRDRFGVKPLFFSHQGSEFAFASEIKQLRSLGFGTGKPQKESCARYLLTGETDDTRETLFEGIQRLMPGESVTWNLAVPGTKPVIESYFSLEISEKIRTRAEWVDGFKALLTDSVRLRLRMDVPAGSCLSGGLDSSSIVSLVHQLESGLSQRTFTSVFKEKGCDESEFAKEVISRTEANAQFVYPQLNDLWNGELDKLIWHQDEPFNSTSVFAQWRVMQAAGNAGVKVLLDGQGADELMGGYLKYVPLYFADLLWSGRWLALNSVWNSMKYSNLRGQLGSQVRLLASAGIKGFGIREWRSHRMKGLFIEENLFDGDEEAPARGLKENLRYDIYHSLQSLLRYEDRNSMAFSVEARTPFLDYRVVEWTMAGREEWFYEGGWTKSLLRDSMRGILPERVRTRIDKLGFVTPEAAWYKEHNRRIVSEIMSPEGAIWRWMDREKVSQALAGGNNIGFAPLRWLSFNRWAAANRL
jgi:asparagine synthase (glutamine-hydrolysing)